MASKLVPSNVAFFLEFLGLDATSALLLHKADCCQETGQWKRAQKYYEAVLAQVPGCDYAIQSCKVVKELAQEEETAMLRERERSLDYTRTEMSVNFIAFGGCSDNGEPDMDKIATKQIRKELQQMGFSRSILSLRNTTITTGLRLVPE